MKILWVSNSPIGPAAQILEGKYQGSSGGWIQSEYEALNNIEEHQMYFLCSLKTVKPGEYIHKANSTGEVFCVNQPILSSGVRNPKKLVKTVENVIRQIEPDLIQIWGTETCLSNIVAHDPFDVAKVVFIQGLIGVHVRYLNGYFSRKKNKKYFAGEKIISRLKSVVREKQFLRQADIEADTLSYCKNVIVDSNFAKAYCMSVTEDIRCYRHILKPNRVFYKHKWSLDGCRRHTIFTVYGSSSEKGLQQLLKAVSLVKTDLKDIKILIPGPFSTDEDGKLKPSSSNGFETVLRNMIDDLNLQENVEFLGKLSANEMADAIYVSHIFVNPSCMEVHALSLREAMCQGVPCISSLCGSVGELIMHGENGFIYRYEEYEVLAFYIKQLMENDNLAVEISSKAVCAIEEMEQRDENRTLTEIYYAMKGD